MEESVCALCAVYHPHADPHRPERGMACDSSRARLEHDRLAVRAMYLRLLEEQPDLAEAQDPVSVALPMAAVPSRSTQPRVSGSRERQLPIRTDVVDLTASVQEGAVRDPNGDQVGQLSVASVLHSWVRRWRDDLFPSHRLPEPEAVALLDWLGSTRLDRIADTDPAVGDFADELGRLRSALRRALGETTPRPEVMWGVPCRRCDRVSTLVLDLDDPRRYRECRAAGCGLLLTEAEYKSWLVDIVEKLRGQRETG